MLAGARSGLALGLAALLSGCSFAALFPVATQHTGDWATSHGQRVIQAGGPSLATVANGMTCTMCHTVTRNPDGSVADSRGSSVTCFSCHQSGPSGSPHAASWKHGQVVIAAGGVQHAAVDGVTCSRCHATERLADGTLPGSPAATSSCFSCHVSGPSGNPHDAGWDHGRSVVDAGGVQKAKAQGQACSVCHTTARLTSGAIPVSPEATSSCFSCHVSGPTGSPHAASWDHGPFVVAAGGYALAMENGKTCSECHTTERQADGTLPASPRAASTCFSCHANGPAGSPHAAGWRHEPFLERNGGYQNALIDGLHCASCHTVARAADGSVPPSPGAKVTCYSCHQGPRGD